MSNDDFEELVAEALASLPPYFAHMVENVQVIVQSRPSQAQRARLGLGPGQTLFGLYEGIPLTRRTAGYSLVLPDRITIFQEPIESACLTAEEIRVQVRHTVVHELAHFFGISDERLRELGAY